MTGKLKYQFTETTWQYRLPGGWHFVSLPKKLSEEIRQSVGKEEQGWGRLTVLAKIGNSEWKTAIWFDTKQDTYLLPLKAETRKKENITPGSKIQVIIWI